MKCTVIPSAGSQSIIARQHQHCLLFMQNQNYYSGAPLANRKMKLSHLLTSVVQSKNFITIRDWVIWFMQWSQCFGRVEGRERGKGEGGERGEKGGRRKEGRGKEGEGNGEMGTFSESGIACQSWDRIKDLCNFKSRDAILEITLLASQCWHTISWPHSQGVWGERKQPGVDCLHMCAHSQILHISRKSGSSCTFVNGR